MSHYQPRVPDIIWTSVLPAARAAIEGNPCDQVIYEARASIALAVIRGNDEPAGYRTVAMYAGLSRETTLALLPKTKGELSEHGLIMCVQEGSNDLQRMLAGRWVPTLTGVSHLQAVRTTSTPCNPSTPLDVEDILMDVGRSNGLKLTHWLASPHLDIWTEAQAGHLGWALYVLLGCPQGETLSTTRADIQAMLGLSRQRTNRLLTKLGAAGVALRHDQEVLLFFPESGDLTAFRADRVALHRYIDAQRAKALAAATLAEVAMAYSMRKDWERIAAQVLASCDTERLDRLLDLQNGGIVAAVEAVQRLTRSKPSRGAVEQPVMAEPAMDITPEQIAENTALIAEFMARWDGDRPVA
jgi:hypothetical protein